MLDAAVADSLWQALREASQAPTAEAYGRLGQIHESLEAHRSATDYFRRAERLNPGDYRWPYYRGCVAQVVGDSAKAVEAFETVRRMNPAYPTTYARLGHLYLDWGRDTEAARCFQEYIDRFPEDWLGDVGLARIALAQNLPHQALSHLQRAETRSPHDFQVNYYLGKTHAALGDEATARRYFARSRELPKGGWFRARDALMQELYRSANAVSSLVQELDRLTSTQQWARMAELAEQVIERRPDDVTMMINLASLRRKLKQFDKAHAVLDRAEAVGRNPAPRATARAEVYLAEHRFDRAIEAADQALGRDPDNAAAHAARGRALFLDKRLPEAEEAMRRSLALDPDSASNLFVLGEILLARGNHAEAVTVFQRALDITPDYAPAADRLKEITAAP
jgi:tetratricopeptide (TPR) repeat protein